MIKVNHVKKEFKGNQKTLALQDVNINIEPHEFVAIIGPSGCGKTTLLNMIAGYDSPTEGEILMHGKKVTQPHHTRAVISQENTLYPWLNVSQNIAYGMKARGLNKHTIEQNTQKILEDVNLSDYAKHKTFEISGGMKQRVSLARTLINDPEVILLDEPLGALDTLTRRNMQNLIHDLWKDKNLTVLMITHDIEEALLLATKIYVMSKGPGKIINEYHPTFYQSENFDTVNLEQSFVNMKKEIMEQI